jgi:hypothetical protein
VWVAAIAACFLIYGLSFSSILSNFPKSNFYVATISWSSGGGGSGSSQSTDTPVPIPTVTATPAVEVDSSVWSVVTPEP